MNIGDSACVNQKTVRALTGLSERQFYRLVKAGVFLPVKKARFNLSQCVQAWGKYQADGQKAGDMATEKTLLIIAQRKKVELDTQEKRGELVLFDQARQTFMAAMTIVATQLDGLAGRVAGELAGISDPAVIRKKLFDETRRIRSAAADKLEEFAGGS